MNALRPRGGVAAAALSATIFLIGQLPLLAQETPTEKPPEPSVLSAALETTRARGAATIAVFTAADQPASGRLWSTLNDGPWARANRGLVQIVNVSKDAEPDLVRTMGVTRFPTVVVYAQGPQGVAKLGTITDCETAESLSVWLRALDLGPGREGQGDGSVTPTLYGGDVRPSQQVPPAPPGTQAAPPVQTQTQPQPPATMLMAVPQPATTAANVVHVPSQSLMIQQAPPQVFLAPQQSPIVYVPQVMSAAPAAVAAPAPVGNLFLTTPGVAAAPAPTQPSLAVAATATPTAAPSTMAVASSAPATLAVGAGTPTLAVNNQTLSLASTGSRSRVRVRGPGLLNSSLARFGERLTRLGRTRIESVQETTLEAPVSQLPGGGLTTISTTSTTPVVPPQQPTTVLVQSPEEVCQHKCRRPCRHREHGPCQHEGPNPCPPPAAPQGPPRLTPTPQDHPEKTAP